MLGRILLCMDTIHHEQENSPEVEMSPELKAVMDLALQAGEVLKKYHNTSVAVDYKQDQFDPVSIADRESDELLRTGLTEAFPDDQILSEENPLLPESYEGRVWMVDPLDDTKGFLAGRDSPGIMIGLLDAGRPTLGVVYLPFRNEWYYGEAGKGSFVVRDGQTTRLQAPATTEIEGARFVGRIAQPGDIRPIEQAIAQLPFGETINDGCIGAKVGLIASGRADAFIHTNLKAGKWDTLAPQVILAEAGGAMCDVDGNPLDYTKEASGWNRYFVAASTPELLQTVVTDLAQANATEHYF